MSCKSVNRLIYLKREELSESEWKNLKDHLKICSFCLSERREFEKIDIIIFKLNKVEPAFSQYSLIEENILKAVEQSKVKNQVSVLNKVTNQITEFFTVPAVRFVVTAFLIFTFSIFFFEEYSGVIGISRLEASISKNFNREIITSGVFDDQLKLLNSIPELYRLLNGSQNYAMLSDDWMLMNINELKSILKVYKDLNSIKTVLPANFKTEYPLLAEFANQDLNESNIDKLLNHKKEILSELEKFMKKGGIENEDKK
jgi:hypothetical protein